MLSRCLAKVCDDDQRNWDENTVLMGYRASCQASTKHFTFVVPAAHEATN